ncbi:hypothetical protein QB910_000120 [Dabrowskivirus KKP3916]|nr:hypothetical protein QB910_000120 [Alicyclobacillus phage KKP 3916]
MSPETYLIYLQEGWWIITASKYPCGETIVPVAIDDEKLEDVSFGQDLVAVFKDLKYYSPSAFKE